MESQFGVLAHIGVTGCAAQQQQQRRASVTSRSASLGCTVAAPSAAWPYATEVTAPVSLVVDNAWSLVVGGVDCEERKAHRARTSAWLSAPQARTRLCSLWPVSEWSQLAHP